MIRLYVTVISTAMSTHDGAKYSGTPRKLPTGSNLPPIRAGGRFVLTVSPVLSLSDDLPTNVARDRRAPGPVCRPTCDRVMFVHRSDATAPHGERG
jgi:hypothetical protein